MSDTKTVRVVGMDSMGLFEWMIILWMALTWGQCTVEETLDKYGIGEAQQTTEAVDD